jgi:hypothetical protein
MGNPESWDILAAIMNIPIFWIVVSAILMVLEFWAALRVIKSDGSRESKCLWILALVFVPVISLIAWVVAGPKVKATRSA